MLYVIYYMITHIYMYLLIKINIMYRYNMYFININFVHSIAIYKKMIYF